MGEMQEKRAQALELYLKGYTLEEIARVLERNLSSLYRWKEIAKKEGKDWDKELRKKKLSPSVLKNRYFKLAQDVLEHAEADEKYKLSPAFADAMAKHIKNLRSIAPDTLQEGIVLDFIEVSNQVLEERAPELRNQLVGHWLVIRNRLLEYIQKKVS